MGNNIQKLERSKEFELSSPLLQESIEKLKEYYSSFKNISDDYTINLTQYEQIFSMDEASFRIWDAENYGRLDAFEIFSGLILFAKAPFEDKARFLFEIFDMNETGIMEFTEIEFMLNTCLFSLFKIKNIKDSVDEDEISAFVEKNFVDDTKLDFSAFFKWMNMNKYVWMCLKAVGQQSNFTVNENNNINIYRVDGKPHFLVMPEVINPSDEESEPVLTALETGVDSQKVYDHLKSFMEDNLEFSSRKVATEVQSLTISAVFGVELCNIRNNMILHSDRTQSGKSEKLIYSVNNVVVIYYHRLNLQDYYLNHKSKVTALCVSTGSLIASSEGLVNSQINIWDIKTKETLYILSQTHVSAVSVMQFIDDDRKLVTISVDKGSHVAIHNLENEELTFSFHDQQTLKAICYSKAGGADDSLEFYLLGERHINSIKETKLKNKLVYKQENLDVSKIKRIEPITCGFLCYTVLAGHFLLTGHKDGRLIAWADNQFKNVKKKYKNGVIRIAQNDIGHFVLLKGCQLIIWNAEFDAEIKKIDFSKKRPFSADFSNFVSVIAKESEIFLVTDQGQVFRYKLQFKQQVNVFTQQMEVKLKHQADRFKAIFSVSIPKFGAKFLVHNEQEYLAFVNRGKEIILLYLEENDCNYKIKFNDTIVDFDIKSSKLGLHVVVAFDTNEVGYFVNNKLRTSRIFKEPVLKVILVNKTESLVVLTKRNNLFKFNKKDDNFFITDGNTLRLYETEDQLFDMAFLDDTQQIVLVTKKSFLYLCDHKLFNKFTQVNSKQKLNLESYLFRSYLPNNDATVTSYLAYDNISACATTETLYVYPDRLRFKQGQYFRQSFGETARIIDMVMNLNKNEMYLFLKDMIIKYKLNVVKRALDESGSNDVVGKTPGTDLRGLQGQLINENLHFMDSLRYIKKLDNKMQDENKLFLEPVNRDQPLIYKNSTATNEERKMYQVRFPPISLSVEYIYGIDTSNGKDCVSYCHIGYHKDTAALTNPDQEIYTHNRNKNIKSLKLSSNEAREMIFSKYKHKPYYEMHASCSRSILYYFDKYAIVYDPRLSTQKHYTDHRNKISCLSISPCKRVIATGELQTGYSSRINVWLAASQFTICTFLLKMIVSTKFLAFSCNGDYLIAIGTDQQTNYCAEVYYWKNSELQCSLILGSDQINDIVPHNYHNAQFTIVENQALRCFSIEGRFLNCKVRYDNFDMNNSSISALIYFYYILGDDVDNDYIVGKTDGSLGLVTFGKYKIIHSGAHEGAVTILRITDVMEHVVVIISAGEDQTICFWDSKLELIKKLDLGLSSLWKVTEGFNHSARSIDIYACEHANSTNLERGESEGTAVILLVSTHNNEVMEIKLKTEYKGIREEEDENEKFFIRDRTDVLDVSYKSVIIKQILFDYNLIFKYNASKGLAEKTVSDFVLNHSGDILATFSNHNEVFFWDAKKNRLLYELRLTKQIKAVRFLGSENIIGVLCKDNSIDFFALAIVQVSGNPFYIKNCVRVENVHYQSDYIISRFDIRSTGKGYMIMAFIESCIDNNSNKHNILLMGLSEVYIVSDQDDELKLSLTAVGDISVRYEGESLLFQRSVDEAIILSTISHQISEDGSSIFLDVKKVSKNSKTEKFIKSENFSFFFDLSTFKQKQFTELPKQAVFKKVLSENDILVFNICFSRQSGSSENIEVISKTISKAELDHYLILGTDNGEIVLTKMFYNEKLEQMNQWKRLKRQGKPVSAHASAIRKLTLDQSSNTLFSLSSEDNCLIKWGISFTSSQWEMDHQVFSPTKDYYTKLDSYFETVQDRRKEIKHLKKLTQVKSPQFRMELDRVISRRASDRFNNMYAALGGCVVFSTDSLIVIMHTRDFEKKNLREINFKQEFLMLESYMDNQFSCPEISTFTMTVDRRRICIGTAEEDSALYFWDINSKQFIQKLILVRVVIITHIRYSFDSKYVLVIGLIKQKRQVLFLVDLTKTAYILATAELSYSEPFKIKDAGFFPEDRHKFMTIGEQHVTEWNYNAGILNFKELKLERSLKMDKGGLLNLLQEKRISKNKSADEKNVS